MDERSLQTPGASDDLPQSGREDQQNNTVSLKALEKGLEAVRINPAPWIELAILAGWTLWFGSAYMNFNPEMLPIGREFSSNIQTHYLWENVKTCGWCAFWNGSVKGGVPAFADVFGSMLHPLVAVTTLFFGVVNGSKVTLLASFWLAGLAQWWLAKELNFSRIPRMWSAMLVIVAGHLGGRMDLGILNVVLATASCSLVIPAVLRVYNGGGRKAVVLLGVTAAGMILSGSGYMQISLLFTLPGFVFLLLRDDLKLKPIWRDYAQAGLLALLLSAPLLIPFLHFAPNFAKFTDSNFNVAQPIPYLALNLLIDDPDFYLNESLSKVPFPYLYTIFIGWAAVILSIVGVSLAQKKDRNWVLFLITIVVMSFLLGSATLLRWLVDFLPEVAGIQNPPQIAGLAVTPILALAAYGLDSLLKMKWPTLKIEPDQLKAELRLSMKWLLLIPLFFSLFDAKAFSQTWVKVDRRGEDVAFLLRGLQTQGLEWVNPPFGEHFYVDAAIGMGLKLSPGIIPWRWKDREIPVAVLEASRNGEPPGIVTPVQTIDGVTIYARETDPYAAVYGPGGVIIALCTARGVGAWIDVQCNSPSPGRLIVRENMWSGWRAWQADAGAVPLLDDLWLEVNAPAGERQFQFRYIPWDVLVGLAVFLTGVWMTVQFWRETKMDE